MNPSPQTTPIDLAITKTPSFIADKFFVEQIQYHFVEQLMENECLKDKWDLMNYSQKIAANSYINEREQLRAYMTKYKKKLNGFAVDYKKAKHGWGRVFPNKSLGITSFAKKTRNTLIKNMYYDFDLKNAQPEILRCICLANKIPCPIIEKYCNERETIIADIITASGEKCNRDLVKSLMIRLSFYGGFEGWLKENEIPEFPEPLIVKNYRNEIQQIANEFIKANPEFYETMRKGKENKGEKNFKGAFMSTYLQEWELRIVENVLKHLCCETNICTTETPNHFLATYEFDGLKLIKERVDDYDGVQKTLELMNRINKEFGFDIIWELKPIEKFYDIKFKNPTPPISNKEAEKENKKQQKEREKAEEEERKFKRKQTELAERIKKEKINRISSDDEAIEYLYEHYKNSIVRTGDGWYTRMEGENWYSFGDEYVKQIINDCNFCIGDGLTIHPYSRNSTGCNKIFEKLKNSPLCFPVNENFINEINKKTKGKVYFEDKYYDLKKKQFFEFKKDDEIPLEFIREKAPDFSEVTEEDITELTEKVLSVFENKIEQQYFLKIIARAIGGFNNDKIWYCMLGSRNSGKGLIQEQVKSAFKGYITYSDPPIMKSCNTGDASSMRWLVTTKQHTKRINFTNEAKAILDKPVELDGEVLKKCISGGDPVLVRRHFGDEFLVKMNTVTIMSFNTLPTCNPKDALLSMFPIITPFKYVDGELIDKYYKKKDINLKEQVENNERWRNAFRKLIFEAFEDKAITQDELPEKAKAEYSDVMATNMTEPPQILHNNFILDKNGWTSYETIEQIFAPSKYSKDKLAKFLKSRDFEHKQKRQKINGVDYRIWGYKGLKLKEKVKEEEIPLGELDEITGEEIPIKSEEEEEDDFC
jgi:hypothetical protein